MRQINHKLPNSITECIRLIESLGFIQKNRVGKGGHQYKYFHPLRNNNCTGDRPFIIIPYKFFKLHAKHLYDKLICFEFSREEIKIACEDI